MVDVRRSAEDRTKKLGITIDYGPHLALVVNNQDSLYSGRLQVWIPSFGGDATLPSSWHTVSYASPFYGITPYSATQKVANNTATPEQFRTAESNPLTAGQLDTANKQTGVKSFGMWTQPPDLGTRVLVVFADGSVDKGFWIAAVPEVAHGMIPAIGKGASGQPEGEFDPASSEVQTSTDIRKVARPPLAEVAATYSAQGLNADPLRGFISTSSFRESPSKVMGFSTPSNHSFVMDDGDENGQSKLVRIRTASGNQITMHDDTGMIYLINAKGTGWLELSPEGNIDIFGQAGINLASAGDVNIHASNDVNIHAGNNLKMVAMAGAKIQGTKELQLMGAKTYLEGVDSIEMHSCGEIKITSFKDIFIKSFNFLVAQAKCFRWNSGTAKEAEQVPPEKVATVSGYNTTVKRAPSHEPYDQHGNGVVGTPASAAASTGSTTMQQPATQSAAGRAQAGQVTTPATGTVAGSIQSTAAAITVATREEAIALAKNSPAGTVINYGQKITAATNPGTTLTVNTAAAGAAIGGLVGSRFGQGAGNRVAATAGAIAGRLIATGGAFTESDASNLGGVIGSALGNGTSVGATVGRVAGQAVAESLFTGSNLQSTIAENAARYTADLIAKPIKAIEDKIISATAPLTSLINKTNNIINNVSAISNIGNDINKLGNNINNQLSSAFAGGPSSGITAGVTIPGLGSTSIPLQTGSTTINSDGTIANPAMAVQQLSGAEPATSIPAAVGGGNTGFAKGDNCGRPGGSTGGKGSGASGPSGPYAPGGIADPVKEQEMYDYLTKEKGLSHEQAVGMIANIQGESGYKSDAVGDNGNSIGLFQYNVPAGRAGPFEAAVPDWRTNWKGQIDYALTQDPVGKQYASTSFASAGQASDFWVRKFEIPADIPGQQQIRGSYAARIDGMVKKG